MQTPVSAETTSLPFTLTESTKQPDEQLILIFKVPSASASSRIRASLSYLIAPVGASFWETIVSAAVAFEASKRTHSRTRIMERRFEQ